MAKTIIKNTMVDPIEMTCEGCRSVFTYTFDDIERREETMFLGMGTTTRRFIVCPVCKYDNNVPRIIVSLQKDKEEGPAVSEEKSEEEGINTEKEIYCTECQHFEDVVNEGHEWFGALCKKDGHEASPSMYAIQTLHNNCPLKKQEEEK